LYEIFKQIVLVKYPMHMGLQILGKADTAAVLEESPKIHKRNIRWENCTGRTRVPEQQKITKD